MGLLKKAVNFTKDVVKTQAAIIASPFKAVGLPINIPPPTHPAFKSIVNLAAKSAAAAKNIATPLLKSHEGSNIGAFDVTKMASTMQKVNAAVENGNDMEAAAIADNAVNALEEKDIVKKKSITMGEALNTIGLDGASVTMNDGSTVSIGSGSANDKIKAMWTKFKLWWTTRTWWELALYIFLPFGILLFLIFGGWKWLMSKFGKGKRKY